MSEGHIVAEGTKDELIQSVENEITYTFEFDDLDNYSEKNIADINGVIKSEFVDNKLSVTCEKSKNTLNLMISKFLKDNLTFKNMSSKEASLETVFLDITGRSLRD
ncbi:MAG: hypothetical protein LBS33_05230 [Streptococcaceae bacterium]|jgi:ABC-2 type transport system ATP-binding protein|nr:hypothetical protein [Streptococcaceae bacterium]